VLILTAGADVQRDRVEIDVWGWGRALQSWLVDHVVLEGDTARPEIWNELSEFLSQTWPHAGGARMALARLAIETGDGATTDAIYAWARRSGHGQVIAVKGVGGFDRSTPVDGPTFVDVTEAGRKKWQQTRERNEALDCRVYARAAAWLGIDRWDKRRWEQLSEQINSGRKDAPPAGQPNRPSTQQAPRRPSGWMGERRGKWL
jgi:phage terminase large subunit GpA-like protein